MNTEIENAIAEQVKTVGEQFHAATDALIAGDTAKLEKALLIIQKVVRILLVVLGALSETKATK